MNIPYLKIHDNRIGSDNYIFQITIGEYFDLMKGSLFNNTYQRKRVQNSKSIYALLKSDIITGCVMPPIVLAVNSEIDESKDILSQLDKFKENIIILDGLQRSLSICDLLKEKPEEAEKIRLHPIRVELYTNLSKIWLLYRMLTLNTGQTQMSTRHQIEIIYSDYKNNSDIEGVKLITQLEDDTPSKIGEYNFRDIIDGFTSYIQMDYLRLDRLDILDNVKDIERLSKMESDINIFKSFVTAYNSFIAQINDSVSDDSLNDGLEDLHLEKSPFGTNIIKIFNKSQALTGFGAAIAKLRQLGDVSDFKNLENKIKMIDSATIQPGVLKLLKNLDDIRMYAKKIGNDQRFYFYYFFRALFSNDNENSSLEFAAKKAYNQYEREVL